MATRISELLDYCGKDRTEYIPPMFDPSELDDCAGRCMATVDEKPNAPGSGMECGRRTVKCSRCHMDAQLCQNCLMEEPSGEKVCADCYLSTNYEQEASILFPAGCKCGNNGGGDCDWCLVYYDGTCPECGHHVKRHSAEGCEFERGDGYRMGREYPEALGPCSCAALAAMFKTA